MSNIFLKSGGSDANGGTGFASGLAKATLAGCDAIDAAGDTILVSPSHTETTSATVTYTFAGTVANPTKVLCVDSDATDTPTATGTGAEVKTGAGAYHMRISGNAYFEGIKFSCGSTSSAGVLSLNFSGIANQHYKNCDIFEADTHPSALLSIGSNAAGTGSARTKLENCNLKISNATQYIGISHNVHIHGGAIASGTVSPTAGLFKSYSTNCYANLVAENFDMSNLAAGVHLVGVPGVTGNQLTGLFRFYNCKLPSGWSGNLISVTSTLVAPNWRAEMYNCDAGDVHYAMRIEDCYGLIRSETTIVKTGGASDGTTTLSWKMDGSVNANEAGGFLRSSDIAVFNSDTGSAKTLTVDFIHDSVTALTDAEVWLEVDYMGTSGFPLGVQANTKRASLLATATEITTSTATWTTTGLTNPNKQKLSVSITPQEKGWMRARVIVAKDTTIYVDPTLQVT